tara:strand:- start:2802 stop:3179 length:378 start_codon:yes stop_codon:yes gene_type:complete
MENSPLPPSINPTNIAPPVNPTVSMSTPANMWKPPTSTSFFNFELSFPLKVILCLALMLCLHFLYNFLRKKFFGSDVYEGDDDEILKDMEDLEDDNDSYMDDQEYFNENEEYDLEKDLEDNLNKE